MFTDGPVEGSSSNSPGVASVSPPKVYHLH